MLGFLSLAARTAPSLWIGLRPVIGLTALALILLLQLGLYSSAQQSAKDRRKDGLDYRRSAATLLDAERLRSSVSDTLAAKRAFVLSHDEGFAAPLASMHSAELRVLKRLGSESAVDRGSDQRLARLRRSLNAFDSYVAKQIALERSGGHETAVANTPAGHGDKLKGRVVEAIDAVVIAEEQKLAIRRQSLENSIRRSERFRSLLFAPSLLLGLIAFAAAIVLLRARRRLHEAYRRMELLAATDPLTGLLNLRAFFEQVEQLRRPGFAPSPRFAFAIIDIDHFKSVNDRFGHAAGDAALQVIAATLRQVTRADDVVGRIGGEEFALAMPGFDPEGARAACERLRDAVARTPIKLENGVTLLVTVSVGLASTAGGLPSEVLMRRADTALYAAKDTGRNRVQLAA